MSYHHTRKAEEREHHILVNARSEQEITRGLKNLPKKQAKET
jgi:hypothetical protein